MSSPPGFSTRMKSSSIASGSGTAVITYCATTEIKHDSYRLIIRRDGTTVRLWTRNGHDWSDRFPLISEAALRNRNSSFVLDGEAVLLGVDGRSDFNGLH